MSFIEDTLTPLFPGREFTETSESIKTETTVDELIGLLMRIHHEAGFEVLNTIACTDWIEDEVIHLNYILYNYSKKINMMILVKIPRELKDDDTKRTKAVIPTVSHIWPQAEHFELELHEMFGISINGHPRLREFFLENWQELPPLRRDFDTVAFVNEHFEFRPGREDACDVATERKIKMAAKKAAAVAALEQKAKEDDKAGKDE